MPQVTSDEVVSILDFFEELEDPRSAINQSIAFAWRLDRDCDLRSACRRGWTQGDWGLGKGQCRLAPATSTAARWNSIARYGGTIARVAQASRLPVLL